ncbi:MAG TPA: NAD-dependent malic enzyme [Solirubrobacteraceae bacterium]|nr:NAD-dependent malic enzyme [Solirubrobacteraceae bacterium]
MSTSETASAPPPAQDGAILQPSASYSITMRVRLLQRPGSFGQVASAIGSTGAILGAIDLVRVEKGTVLRDVTVSCVDAAHGRRVVEAVDAVDGATVERVLDRTFEMHQGGKIAVTATVPLKSRDDLSMAYTPGVARVCTAIHEDVDRAWSLTIKGNTVAVVSDGTAVLGLGDIGPEAAMPVMEGKALLFKEFAGVDAFPLCVATKDVDEIVAFVKAAAPAFGGINLEDIAAPRCFEIERRLRAELDIPVFHDDQHGTAIVVLAALLNALRLVGKAPGDVRVVVCGAGAAGMACTDILLAQGVHNIVVCDIGGALYRGRPGLDPERAALAERTNPGNERGTADELLAGADVFLGLSGPGAISARGVRSMGRSPIVFAMANPTPEVHPEEILGDVAVMATGRSDYPNQINNVLAFPGVFRGALDVRAATIDEPMKLAAARAIASVIPDDELDAEYIVPSVFNRAVAEAVARAVATAAQESGVARRPPRAAAAGPATTRPDHIDAGA